MTEREEESHSIWRSILAGRPRARRLASLLVLVVVVGTAASVAPAPATAAGRGQVLAWGSNAWGQLGNGTATSSSTPVPVSLPADTRVTAVAAGEGHSLAVTSTGQVLAWGENSSGQLGNGTTTDSSTPVPVSLPAGTRVTAVTADFDHNLALTSTGQVWAWGQGGFGQLGNGTTADSSTPVPVSLPAGTRVTAVAAGGEHSLALTSTGQVLAWGWNAFGQLGNGTTTDSSTPVPVSLPPGTTVTALAGGYVHSLALTSTGQLLAWGGNSRGELGDGTTTDSRSPVPVSLPGGTRVTAVAGGAYHSLAVTSTGQVLAWGQNTYGELGNGTTAISTTPVPVSLPTGTRVTAVAAGYEYSLALTSTGRMLAWGWNSAGQLGNGATSVRNPTPVPVSLPAGTRATAIASGSYHGLATTSGPTTTSLAASSNPTPAGRPVTFTATVSPVPDGGSVAFSYDGSPIPSCRAQPVETSSGRATCTFTPPSASAHHVVARFSGTTAFDPSTSDPLTLAVNAGPTTGAPPASASPGPTTGAPSATARPGWPNTGLAGEGPIP